MLALILLLVLVLVVCSRYQRNQNEGAQDRQVIGNNITGSGGRDGITEGFESDGTDQLLMLKRAFSNQIQPILSSFVSKYRESPDLQRAFRLRHAHAPLEEREIQTVIDFANGVIGFNVNNLYENMSPPDNETSYTSNKTYIYMCLRNSRGKVHANDILLFAFVHELAHAGCNEQGHSDMFWCYFRLLLQILCKYRASGIPEWHIKYCSEDLRHNPYNNYCNTFTVKYNPLFDQDAYL